MEESELELAEEGSEWTFKCRKQIGGPSGTCIVSYSFDSTTDANLALTHVAKFVEDTLTTTDVANKMAITLRQKLQRQYRGNWMVFSSTVRPGWSVQSSKGLVYLETYQYQNQKGHTYVLMVKQ